MPAVFQTTASNTSSSAVYIPTGIYTVTTSITISNDIASIISNTVTSSNSNWPVADWGTYRQAIFSQSPVTYWGLDENNQVQNHDWQNEYDKEIKKKQAAKKKALTLLRMNLSRKQWNNYKELGYFEVISQKGNVYRIYEGRSRNIKRVEEGKVVEVLCAHPKDQVPTGDTLLSQKLMLECMEDTFRHIANIDRIVPNADSLNEWFEVAA